jgi:hypothetical protein
VLKTRVESWKSCLGRLAVSASLVAVACRSVKQRGPGLSLAPSPPLPANCWPSACSACGGSAQLRRKLAFGSCKDLQPSLLVDELCFDINATFIFGFFDLGPFPKTNHCCVAVIPTGVQLDQGP